MQLRMKKRLFRGFWGDEVLTGEQVFLVVNIFQDLRFLDPSFTPEQNRFFKDFPNIGRVEMPGPFEPMSTCDARAVGYLSSAFAIARKQPPKIITDEEILPKWDATLICFGSSGSNVKTREILQLEENTYADFDSFVREGKHIPGIRTKWNNSSFTGEDDPRGDKGLIMKLPNPRFPKHTLTVCAGLGEYGTSGAVFYLSRHWEMLYKRYKGDPFCVIVAVSTGSDESAKEISASPTHIPPAKPLLNDV